MSIIFTEGFDYYRNLEEINQNYWYIFDKYPYESTVYMSLIDLDTNTNFKRFPESKKCIALSGGSNNFEEVYLYKPINPQTKEIVVGVALRYEYQTVASSVPFVLSLYDTTGSRAVSLGINTVHNRYEILDETDTIVDSTPNNVFSASSWHYVELEAEVSSSATIRIYINGILIKEATNIDTLNSSVTDKRFKILRFGSGKVGFSTGVDIYIDDIYLLDKNSTAPNSPLGNIRIDFLTPASANSSNMNASSGTDQAALLRDNNSTTYVYTSATGASAVFTLSSLPHTPKNVYLVSPVIKDKKTTPYPLRHRLSLDENGNLLDFSAKSTENDIIKKTYFTKTPSGNDWDYTVVNNIKLKIERK